MPDLFGRAADWLTSQLAAAGACRSIELHNPHRDPAVLLTIDATPGETGWDEEGIDAAVTRIEARDWIVAADALVVDGEPVRPDRGWIITDSLDDAQHEVFAPGETCWSYCDTSKRRIRIHTRSLTADQ